MEDVSVRQEVRPPGRAEVVTAARIQALRGHLLQRLLRIRPHGNESMNSGRQQMGAGPYRVPSPPPSVGSNSVTKWWWGEASAYTRWWALYAVALPIFNFCLYARAHSQREVYWGDDMMGFISTMVGEVVAIAVFRHNLKNDRAGVR